MQNAGPYLRQLVEAYILEHDIAKTTAVTYRCAANSFVSWFGREPSSVELSANINAYLAFHVEQGSRYTTRTYRGALSLFIRHAAAGGFCAVPPVVRRVSAPEHEPETFADEEIERLLAHSNPTQTAAILLVHDSGFRYGDVFRTTWGDVDPEWCVRIIVGKSGRREVRRLSAASVAACAKLQTEPGPRSKLVPWPHKSRTPWDDAWRALGKKAGVNVHDRGLQAIRRRSASLVAVEFGPAEAARFLGHSPKSGISVFDRYYKISRICDTPPRSPPPMTLPPDEKAG